MTFKPTLSFLLILLGVSMSIRAQEIVCTIKGNVVGRESKNIILCKATDDMRVKSTRIPVTEGRFEYKLTTPVSEAYHLVFEEEHQRGAWRPIAFFAENGEVNFILHEMRAFDKNVIGGGKLNQILANYNAAFHDRFGAKMSSLADSINTLVTDGQAGNPEREALQNKLRALVKKAEKWEGNYIENSRTHNTG